MKTIIFAPDCGALEPLRGKSARTALPACRRSELRPPADAVLCAAEGSEEGVVSLPQVLVEGEPAFTEHWRGLYRRMNEVVREHLEPLFACGDTNIVEGVFGAWFEFCLWPLARMTYAVRLAAEAAGAEQMVLWHDRRGHVAFVRSPDTTGTVVPHEARSVRGDITAYWLAQACRQVARERGVVCRGLTDEGRSGRTKLRLVRMPGAAREAATHAAWWARSLWHGARHAREVLRFAACLRPKGSSAARSSLRPPAPLPRDCVMFVGYAAPQSDIARALAETLPGGLEQAVLYSPWEEPKGQAWPHMRFLDGYWTRGEAVRALAGFVAVGLSSLSPLWRPSRGQVGAVAAVCREYGLPPGPALAGLWRARTRDFGRGLARAWVGSAVLKDVQPRAILVSHAREPGVAGMLWAARKMGIPVGYHMHGLWYDRKAMREASAPLDFALVFGEHYAEVFEEWGLSRERIQIVGRWGEQPLREGPPRPEVEALCAGAEHIVLCLSQPRIGEGQGPGGTWVGTVLAAARALPGVRVLIKLHPAEEERGRRLYRAAMAETGADAALVEHSVATVGDLLTLASAVVTQFSSAGLNALEAEVPLVVVNLGGAPDPYPFVAEGAALGVYRAEDMLPQLRRALFEPETREALREAGVRFAGRHSGPRVPVAPDWSRLPGFSGPAASEPLR